MEVGVLVRVIQEAGPWAVLGALLVTFELARQRGLIVSRKEHEAVRADRDERVKEVVGIAESYRTAYETERAARHELFVGVTDLTEQVRTNNDLLLSVRRLLADLAGEAP